MAIKISNNCTGCGSCIATCPKAALTMGPKGIVIVNEDLCSECGDCIIACPVEALSLPIPIAKNITVTEPEVPLVSVTIEDTQTETIIKSQQLMTREQAASDEDIPLGVWVCAEQLEGELASVTLELIGAATFLANKINVEVSVVLLGSNIEHIPPVLFEYGADRVYLLDQPVFKNYRTEPYRQGVCYLAKKYRPEVLLMSATTTGRDLAGAVATELRDRKSTRLNSSH